MKRLFFPITLIIILAGLMLFKTVSFFINGADSKNPIELAVANWNDGTDAFYQQIIKSNGSGKWIEVDLSELSYMHGKENDT